MSLVGESFRKPKLPRKIAGAFLATLLFAGCQTPNDKKSFDLVNSDRKAHGHSALPYDNAAHKAAKDWAVWLAATDTFEHSNLATRIEGVKWCSLGENIGYTTGMPVNLAIPAIHNAYRNSPGHNANMLRPDSAPNSWTGMGVATVEDDIFKGKVMDPPRVVNVQFYIERC